MGVLFGLISALNWGVSDFCARFATTRIGNFRSYLYMQLAGLLGLSIWLIFQPPAVWDWFYISLAAGLGITNTIAGLALYRAFEIGLLSIVSPVAASYGAISLTLGLLSGQPVSPSELTGLIFTIIGVVLASTSIGSALQVEPGKKARSNNGIGFALLASIFFGVTFWGLGYVTPHLGGVMPVWESRLVAPVIVLALSFIFRQSLQPPTRNAWPWVIAVAILDSAAYIFYNVGLQSAQSGLVAVISSLFSAVTVLLARLFLREKLAANQWAGLALIFVGVGLVSARF
jgi:drug/metabolite transporter (DMT)-like permease